ncbi:hypothetical protein [Methanobrevibacter sp.]|jgi:hypothetical protein|uniref:hypothetical protein n=1 Tax=Methanobrevibacter sp. TaxID=66852 RepID=UPI0038649544
MNYKEPVEICKQIQELAKEYSINLHLYTKDEVASRLTKLYKIRKALDDLSDLLPKHEVFHENGKSLGFLYDNEHMGNVMLSTGIRVNAAIQHTEWHFRKFNCKDLILKRRH